MKRNILKDPWVRLSPAVLDAAIKDADGKPGISPCAETRLDEHTRNEAVRFIADGGGCFYGMAELAREIAAMRGTEDAYAVNGKHIRGAVDKTGRTGKVRDGRSHRQRAG